MTQPLVLYDDARARTFEPFALTRPTSELRAGAALVRQRWELALGRRATGFIGAPHLATFAELDAPRAVHGVLSAGTIVANARFAPALRTARVDTSCWTSGAAGGAGAAGVGGGAGAPGATIAAVRLSAPLDSSRLADGTVTLESLATPGGAPIDGWWCDEVWDFVRLLQTMLTDDIPALAATLDLERDPVLTVLGEHAAHVERGAYIEPFVLADTSAGPVLVRSGARVSAFTRLAGPCAIGAHAVIGGGRVSGCSIGEHARIHGEISTSIVVGHANKAHDGFVGHSVIGRWANLGAGTITSNLKNSYGDVSLWTPTGVRRTGMQFLGSLIGDHVKTGIGTRLTTGCVIGAGANVFGDHMPAKFVPPFAWGDTVPFAEYSLEKFLEVAEKVMRRRDEALDDGTRAQLSAAWRRRGAFSA